jgi:hypothetical protein
MVQFRLSARNATNSQIGMPQYSFGFFSGSSNGAALSRDMTAIQSLTVSAAWGTAGGGSNNITLKTVRVWLEKAAP